MASPSLSALSAYRQVLRATRVAFRGTSRTLQQSPKSTLLFGGFVSGDGPLSVFAQS